MFRAIVNNPSLSISGHNPREAVQECFVLRLLHGFRLCGRMPITSHAEVRAGPARTLAVEVAPALWLIPEDSARLKMSVGLLDIAKGLLKSLRERRNVELLINPTHVTLSSVEEGASAALEA